MKTDRKIGSVFVFRIIFLSAIIGLPFSCKGKQMVDFLVHNAKVYTVNDSAQTATAFAVNGGKFIAVGGDEEILKKYSSKTRMDGKGMSIFPGFFAGILPTGSDFPVEEVNPLLGFYAAITRQDTMGFPEGGFFQNERLTREEALKGMTI